MKRGTPRGLRLHIGIFGRRNVGKSSLLNAVTHQDVSIVSPMAGTTTDPVEKPMELLPLGPVLFVDTAGIDDEGDLGGLRIARTRQVIARTDLALLVIAGSAWGSYEDGLVAEFRQRGVPLLVVANKADLAAPDPALRERLAARGLPLVAVSATAGTGLDDLRAALVAGSGDETAAGPGLVSDLVPPGRTAVLVVPIDLEAPKGRLILPQVQAIRDLLDHDACCLVVKERELAGAMANLREAPALVVTDSQAFLKVAADVPETVPLTSFSILFARAKGDLVLQAAGAMAIGTITPGDRVLIAEACTHHPIGEDIGRIKIPRWLGQHVGGALAITTVAGRDWPDDLADYRLVVHCGACTCNRREMQSRLRACREAGVPVTNYGLAIAYTLGIFPRALRPFPAVAAACGLT